MRIIAFIQDKRSIEDSIKAAGQFQALTAMPKFSYTLEAIDELSSYDPFEPGPDDF